MNNDIMFVEATRRAGHSIIEVAAKYNIELDSQPIREAMAEMFQEGMKYALEVIKAAPTPAQEVGNE